MKLHTRREALALGATAGLIGMSGLQPSFAKAPLSGKQAAGFYRYKAGSIEITAIHEGFAERPVAGFVKNADEITVQKQLEDLGYSPDKLQISFTTLVVNTGDKLVLLDTGMGNSGPPTTGNWMANFKAAGFEPEQVDAVIFSHFHGDHINGYRMKEGNSPFVNAAIMSPATEWNFWMDEGNMSRAPEGMKPAFQNVHRVFDPVKDKMIRFEAGKEIVPGITSIAIPGHTPGHTAFRIGSGKDGVMFMADLTNNPVILARNPDWQIVFDMDGNLAAQTRRKMLDMAMAEKVRVAFYHAPFPATGFIGKLGNGFEFMPAAWNSKL